MNTKRGFGLVVLSVCLLAGCEDDKGLSADVGDNDVNVVVALGDSITQGQGVTPYPAIVAVMTGKTVINAGAGGGKASGGASRVGGLLRKHKPGYLLILLGTNDAIHSMDVETTIAALRSIVQQAKANRTIPVLGTLPPMTDGHEIYNGGIVARNPRIAQLAAEEGVALADVGGAFGGGAGLLSEGGLHPNLEGQTTIARAFAGMF